MVMVSDQKQSYLPGLYPPEGGTWNDRISCIETGPWANVTVCTDVNFKGQCMKIGGNQVVDLTNNSTYNNKISSIWKQTSRKR